MIVVLDYGMGNLRSVQKAIEHLGFACSVQPDLAGATKLIIPGVGAFGAAMERIGKLGDDVRRFARDGRPILGICLGQQLLFERSEEFGAHEGLGLLSGCVRYLPRSEGLKVPHMGWNALEVNREDGLMSGVSTGDQVYFVHSLYTECGDPADVAATAEHGIEFAAAVQRANVWGVQFHPEKSGAVGLRILRNFLSC